MISRVKQQLTTITTLLLILALTLTILIPTTIANAAPEPADVPAFVWTTEVGLYGSDNGQFNTPRGIAIDSNNNVYVADANNHRIQKFDANGTYLSQWGSYGTGDAEFDTPEGVASDSSDNIYVTDSGNNRIQKFDANGSYLTKWGSTGSGNGQFSYPQGATTDAFGNVYVADYNNNRIQKFDADGTYLAQWGSSGSGNGEFSGPYGIAIDFNNNTYVTDSGNNRIQKFDANGTYLTKWGSTGSGNGEYNYPQGIDVDASGNIYVADSTNSRIQKFSSDGTYLAQWGTLGADNGQMSSPTDLEIGLNGEIYMSDGYNSNNEANNNRIQKFTYPPETASLTAPDSSAAIQLESTAFTTFSCSTSVTEDSLTTTDTSQDYPLGLVDFCLDVVPGSTNTVSLTFETDLTPEQVTATKYNPTTQTYTDIPGATITATTLNSNPALKLTYDIADGGDLDDDGIANGTILDPVGLGIDAAADTEALAATGENTSIIYIVATFLLIGSIAVLRRIQVPATFK